MALTYTETFTLSRDEAFIGRVQVAALHFATYIQNEGPGTPGHSSRYKWAQTTALQPEATARQIVPVVVMEPQVQDAGAAITDTDLQVAVETTVNRLI